jgi:hypothetical protein
VSLGLHPTDGSPHRHQRSSPRSVPLLHRKRHLHRRRHHRQLLSQRWIALPWPLQAPREPIPNHILRRHQIVAYFLLKRRNVGGANGAIDGTGTTTTTTESLWGTRPMARALLLLLRPCPLGRHLRMGLVVAHRPSPQSRP